MRRLLQRTLRARWSLASGVAACLMAAGCSASGPSSSATERTATSAEQPNAVDNGTLAAAASAGDIHSTSLPDTNYASQDLLDVRKRGLAAESAADADPTKTGTVDPDAVDPYTRAEYPDVVRRWGKLVPVINRERKLAAGIAAKDPRCDGVDNAQITDHGSRTDRHYMIECNNITRVYFDRRSLAAHRPALVRTEADMGAQGVLDW